MNPARPRKRIALLGFGTRGDLQPLLVVGDELRRRGHEVRITCNTNLVPWARRSGLDIIDTPPDCDRFLKSREGQGMLADGKVVAFATELAKLELAVNAEIDRACAEACEGADLIVSTGLSFFRGAALAEATGLPHRLLCTMPLQRTGAYASLLGPVRRFRLPALNRLSYGLVYDLWWRNFADAHNRSRATLGLAPIVSRPRIEDIDSVGVYSQALMPDDGDRGAQHHVAGFTWLNAELRQRLGENEPPADMMEWIEGGEPPIYFGFGSLPVGEPAAMLARIADICGRRGWRALVGAGTTAFDPKDVPEHVFLAPVFDHDRVLPKCRAAVHHGGAGTTAAALRAGLPSLIITSFADQPFWGWRVEQMGVGATFAVKKMSTKRLERGLLRLAEPELVERTRRMAEVLGAERADEAAADVIEGWMGIERAGQLSMVG